jgi:uncharacterized protein
MNNGRQGWSKAVSGLRRSIFLGLVLIASGASPAIAQVLQNKVVFASRDINDMWTRQFRHLGRTWVQPKLYIYSGRILTPCGGMGNWNAQYCPRNHSIYLNEPFVSRVDHRVGDFAAITVMAHEYGHAVQRLLGLNSINRYPVQDELQADCLAGMYAQDAMSRKLLDESDIPEANAQSYASGDRNFDINSHGTPQQRVQAFQLGYGKGLHSCLSYSTWHRR